MAFTTGPAEAPANPIHNLLLAVAEVFDPNEAGPYLKYRYHICQPGSEAAEALAPVGLPHTCPTADLPVWDAETLRANEIEARKACLRAAADRYFPLFSGEEVRDDFFTYLVAPFHSASAGAPILVRTTNKAVLLAVAQQSTGSEDLPTLTIVPQLPTLTVTDARVYAEAAQVITQILSCFAKALPGPVGTFAKTGIELLSFALSLAGDKGPSSEQMMAMIRGVVREELVKNDLEKISAGFAAIKEWSDDTYLPAKRAPQPDIERLRHLIDAKAEPLLTDLHTLNTTNHRVEGFPLLMIGVPIYLSLLQESLSLGVPHDLHAAGVTWAKNVCDAWEAVKLDRKNRIEVYSREHISGCPPMMRIYSTWHWIDHVEGCSGPRFEDEKSCRRSASSHYEDAISRLTKEFADVEATAAAWEKLGTAAVEGGA